LAVLREAIDRRQGLDVALDKALEEARFSQRDRGFIRLLAVTTLRRLGEIDRLLLGYVDRNLLDGAPGTRWVLRMGLAQLLFLETAPHAAVGTAPDLLPRKEAGLKKLVNAVLRRAACEAKPLSDVEAVRANTPDWLWESWCQSYGEATAAAIAGAQLAEPPLDLTVPKDRADWQARLGGRAIFAETLRLPAGSGAPSALDGYAEGAWWVQDAAATLPVALLRPRAGERIADLCAAPGGKTLQLAAAGAEVMALDRSAARLARLKENLERCGLSAAVVEADLTEWETDLTFDAVLLDAPCTATGTMRRHPDIAWLRQPAEVEKLAALQARLLDRAWRLLKPGGRLVYAVCSLEAAEGPAQIHRLLASGAPLALDRDARPQGVPDAWFDELGGLRTLPSHMAERGGLDGFYVCALRRHA